MKITESQLRKIIRKSIRKRLNEDTAGEWGYVYNNPFEIKNPQEELTYQNVVKILEKYMDLVTETIYDPGNYFYRDDMFPPMFDNEELTFYATYNGIPCLLMIGTDCWSCEYDGEYDRPYLVNCTFDPICVQLCTDGEHGYKDIYYHDFETGEKWIGKERQPNEPINVKLHENRKKENKTAGKINKAVNESVKKTLKKVLKEDENDFQNHCPQDFSNLTILISEAGWVLQGLKLLKNNGCDLDIVRRIDGDLNQVTKLWDQLKSEIAKQIDK